MQHPLEDYIRHLLHQNCSARNVVIEVVTDNCAMIPETNARSAQHERIFSLKPPSHPDPELSRWDSLPTRARNEDRREKLSSANRKPVRPRRMSSFDDNNVSFNRIDEASRILLASPPQRPERKVSFRGIGCPSLMLSAGDPSEGSGPESSTHSKTLPIDSFLENLSLQGTLMNKLPEPLALHSESDITAKKIQPERFLRFNREDLDKTQQFEDACSFTKVHAGIKDTSQTNLDRSKRPNPFQDDALTLTPALG
jgi:hypothetical protein